MGRQFAPNRKTHALVPRRIRSFCLVQIACEYIEARGLPLISFISCFISWRAQTRSARLTGLNKKEASLSESQMLWKITWIFTSKMPFWGFIIAYESKFSKRLSFLSGIASPCLTNNIVHRDSRENITA